MVLLFLREWWIEIVFMCYFLWVIIYLFCCVLVCNGCFLGFSCEFFVIFSYEEKYGCFRCKYFCWLKRNLYNNLKNVVEVGISNGVFVISN